jgi:hypothetical protein
MDAFLSRKNEADSISVTVALEVLITLGKKVPYPGASRDDSTGNSGRQ